MSDAILRSVGPGGEAGPADRCPACLAPLPPVPYNEHARMRCPVCRAVLVDEHGIRRLTVPLETAGLWAEPWW